MVNKTRVDESLYFQTNLESRHLGLTPTITLTGGSLGKFTSSVDFGPNIPGWRQLIKQGQNATTSMVGTKVSFAKIHSASSYSRIYGLIVPHEGDFAQSGRSGVKSFTTYLSSGTMSYGSLYDKAVIGYLGKVNDENRSFQTGIFVGELRETVHMLRNPIESLRKGMLEYLKAVKKRSSYIKFSTGSGTLRRTSRRKQTKTSILNKMVSDTWLEYSFGWRPFIQDIQSGVRALNALSSPRPSWTRVSFRAEDTIKRDIPYPVPALAGGDLVSGGMIVQEYETASVRLWGAVTTEPISSPSKLQNTLGLTLREFVPTIWELTPWSFLVDYFANVGGFIDALSTDQTRIRWTSRTDITRIWAKPMNYTSIQLGAYPGPGNGLFWVDWCSGSASVTGKAERTFVNRRAWPGLLIPSIVFRIPGTSTRWLNISALTSSSKATTRSLMRRL